MKRSKAVKIGELLFAAVMLSVIFYKIPAYAFPLIPDTYPLHEGCRDTASSLDYKYSFDQYPRDVPNPNYLCQCLKKSSQQDVRSWSWLFVKYDITDRLKCFKACQDLTTGGCKISTYPWNYDF